MPDVDFYTNLQYQFETIRDAQLALDECVNNLTGLMEQAAHLRAGLESVPPLVADDLTDTVPEGHRVVPYVADPGPVMPGGEMPSIADQFAPVQGIRYEQSDPDMSSGHTAVITYG